MSNALTVTITAVSSSPSLSSIPSSKKASPAGDYHPNTTTTMDHHDENKDAEADTTILMDGKHGETKEEELTTSEVTEEELPPPPTDNEEEPSSSMAAPPATPSSALPTAAASVAAAAAASSSAKETLTSPVLSPPAASATTKNQKEDDDGDSSNDDSSYFADPSNLPSPKSGGRKYSFSSHHSAPLIPPSSNASTAARESDASLSLSSDDSEDEMHHHSDGGLLLTTQQIPSVLGTPDVYPHQGITRVHSVGSLISTSSQNSSEDIHLEEQLLQTNAGGGPRNYLPGEIPSGRRSPDNFDYGAGTPLTQPSPPPIMAYQGYPFVQGVPHPRAGPPGSSEEWIAAMAANQQFHPMQATGSGWSEGTLSYSDDGGDVHAFSSQNRNLGGGSNNNNNINNNSQQPQGNQRSASSSRRSTSGVSGNDKTTTASSRTNSTNAGNGDDESDEGDGTYQVYWQRWIMLAYMSVLNLLSDWTCYSVAPIALLTQQAFGNINPEELVVVFLGANAVATACEPIILSRLGLRRTVLFGALLLMIGSVIKSGGMPPIIQAELKKGEGEWRVYVGFFLVGLSQPLYQCTPALLSGSWFPEKERTMATGVALNANQLGIGFAFIFGTLLVAKSDDIPGYFGLLSLISTITFFGALFQFEDAPPTPPSQTARVVRGDLDIRLPSVRQVLESIGLSGRSDMQRDINEAMAETRNPPANRSSSFSSNGKPSGRRKKSQSGKPRHSKAPAPSSAPWDGRVASAPSPMMPGSVANAPSGAPAPGNEEKEEGGGTGGPPQGGGGYYGQPPYYGAVPPPPPHMGQMGYPMYPGMPYNFPGASYSDNQQVGSQYGSTQQGGAPYGQPYGVPPQGGVIYGQEGGGGVPPPTQPYGFPPQGYPPYPMPFFDPRSGQYVYPPLPPQYYPPQAMGDPYGQGFRGAGVYSGVGPYDIDPRNLAFSLDEGAEPILRVENNHLEIDIRDDQVLLSIRACAARPGFIHALVSFTVSGIVINTLSTFMDYLVRLNGAGREMTGIVGGTFQFVIMGSSLLIGGMTDRSRAYYSVTVGMLVLGAFGLAECGVSLNADRGSDLRVALIVVAVLVGPLQPVSTELGVEVVYPLSENTVLVIQQLFSNLLSALFIPCFKKMKDIGINQIDTSVQQPEYTFSFYLLIVLHAGATVFFATFNGRYLRYEHELRKEEERANRRSFSNGDRQPLIQHHLV
eukprot:scaffold491_cov160-Amphora_coffeaeformis.AAC.6